MPFVHSCKVAAVPGSDHVPLMTALLPVKLDGARGKGRWRAQLGFLSDAALQERLVSFARQHVDNLLHCSAQQLIETWPRVKALYRQQVSECMQLFAAARRASPSEQAAALLYRQALAALDVAPAAEQHVCLQQALQAQAHLSQVMMMMMMMRYLHQLRTHHSPKTRGTTLAQRNRKTGPPARSKPRQRARTSRNHRKDRQRQRRAHTAEQRPHLNTDSRSSG
jgi:hypothetical protein